MSKNFGYAALSGTRPLAPFTFERRELGSQDVEIKVLFCGVCHSDIHLARNEWQNTVYPIVPGHEIVGRVTRVGSQVKSFKSGDLAGIGCMVDSCRTCASCAEGLEQYCENELVLTYNSPDKHTGEMTYGGYSNLIISDQRFVLRVAEKLELPAVAPLLCAGITTYSPLRH
jgi:alcohol dehydrogenase (NADP+)